MCIKNFPEDTKFSRMGGEDDHDQKKQARGARSLGKIPKYCNKKKPEKQIFYLEIDFPSVKFFQLKTILNQSEEKWKIALFSLFKEIKGDYRELKTVQKV